MEVLPLVEELVPAPEPLQACGRLADLPSLVLLDSVMTEGPLGQYSFLTADPVALVRSKGALTQQRTAPDAPWVRVDVDPLTAVRQLVAPFAAAPVPGLPPFQGGAAGYLGYDWGAMLEQVPRPRYDDLAIPDVLLGIYDWVVAWDHATSRAWLVSTGMPERGPSRAERAARRLAFVKERLAGRAGSEGGPRRPPASPATRLAAPTYPVSDVVGARRLGLRSNFTRDGYLEAVARVIEYVFAGDIFQANLSQRLEAPLVGTPLDLYCRLRSRNPAPFSAYLNFGDLVVASSSPERFLRVRDGHVEARPIKGTRPRGVGPEHDAALALALAESAKDRAENVMIVDLLRNDLVSTVAGDLDAAHDPADLVRAAFPGGSITGAPKVRAMQIIAELEPTQRGVYCGAVGYWSVTGEFDTSVVIRTYLILGDVAYFQAGGAVVADSDPEQEYRETLDKASGLVAALAP
jgi:para-aminobenzoate synthetase component 1